MKQPISAKKILTFTSIGLLGLIVVTECFLRYFYADKLSIHCRPAIYNPLPVVNYGYTPDTIIQIAKKSQLPLVTLRTSFSENDYIPGNGHWNGLGCKKADNQFYDLITKHKLIPEK